IATTTGNAASFEGKILVFVNLGYSRLDGALTNADLTQTNAWIVDQTTGKIKTSYALDMDNKDIVNVQRILSASGLWSIDENGKLIAREIETQKLTVTGPQGITIYDKKGQAGCLSVEDVATGAINVTPGACGIANVQSSVLNTSASTTPDTIPPTITILGNNPSVVEVGTSWADPGVTITDNVDQNLGYTASLNGGPALSQGAGLELDTSTTTTHTILYTATDSAGNTATTTRIVNVVEPL
ncbi:MAG: DUF5011 domain-containing protein, partial [Candidatus Giovannonibacteria bacterium]|nr:DUF5011 domain-containing protein [Candidatus Giovannonibacteria bacterium]